MSIYLVDVHPTRLKRKLKLSISCLSDSSEEELEIGDVIDLPDPPASPLKEDYSCSY